MVNDLIYSLSARPLTHQLSNDGLNPTAMRPEASAIDLLIQAFISPFLITWGNWFVTDIVRKNRRAYPIFLPRKPLLLLLFVHRTRKLLFRPLLSSPRCRWSGLRDAALAMPPPTSGPLMPASVFKAKTRVRRRQPNYFWPSRPTWDQCFEERLAFIPISASSIAGQRHPSLQSRRGDYRCLL